MIVAGVVDDREQVLTYLVDDEGPPTRASGRVVDGWAVATADADNDGETDVVVSSGLDGGFVLRAGAETAGYVVRSRCPPNVPTPDAGSSCDCARTGCT